MTTLSIIPGLWRTERIPGACLLADSFNGFNEKVRGIIWRVLEQNTKHPFLASTHTSHKHKSTHSHTHACAMEGKGTEKGREMLPWNLLCSQSCANLKSSCLCLLNARIPAVYQPYNVICNSKELGIYHSLRRK